MRLVLDANVLLAAFATRGLCEALMAVVLESHRLIISEHLLTEVGSQLVRKFKISTAQVEAIDAFLRAQAESVEPARVPSKACRDRDDLPVLGTMVAGRAAALVTGDKDLLVLESYQGIPIITPRACYERIR